MKWCVSINTINFNRQKCSLLKICASLLFFLVCQDGYFGENCIRECSIQCQKCNKSSGICDQGCHPGWKGTYCTEGMYSNQSLGYSVIQATNIRIKVMTLSNACE